MIKESELMTLCEGINNLEDNTQINLLSYISGKTDELELNQEEEDKTYELVTEIVQLIVDGLSEETIKSSLEKCELNKIFINPIYKYCTGVAEPYVHAKIVKNIDQEKLISTCNFVLNNAILYFEHSSIRDFAKSIDAEHEIVRNIISFVYNYYSKVCSRELSPNSLKTRLRDMFDFSEERIEVFIKPLLDNLAEAQQAYLLSQVDELLQCATVHEPSEEE